MWLARGKIEQFAYPKLHLLFSQRTLARRISLLEPSPPCQESCHAETFGSRLGTRLQRKSRLPEGHGNGGNGSVKQETSLSNEVQVWQHFTWLKHLSTLFHVQGLVSTLSSTCCFFCQWGYHIWDGPWALKKTWWQLASWLLLLVWDWQSDHTCSLRKPD